MYMYVRDRSWNFGRDRVGFMTIRLVQLRASSLKIGRVRRIFIYVTWDLNDFIRTNSDSRHFSQKLELSPEGRSEPHPYKLIINTMYIIHNAFLILSDECNVECMKVSKSVCRQCALTRNVNSFITFRILLFQWNVSIPKKEKKFLTITLYISPFYMYR